MQASNKKETSCKTKVLFYNELLETLHFFYASTTVLIFLSFSVYSQESNISFQHFNVGQGLSSGAIGSIYQDRTGYLWFITDKGLDKFDGYKFINYKYPPKDKVNSRIFAKTIWEDHQGNIWIASFNGGIEKFDPQRENFKNFLPAPDQPATEWCNTIISLYIDKNDIMWIGSGHGFYKFDISTGKFTSFRHNEDDSFSLGHNSVNAIYEDKAGTLWLATGGGLDMFNRQTNKFYHYWHYTNNRWYDPNTMKYWLLSLTEDEDGTLWLAGDGGLVKFDKMAKKFTLYNNIPSSIYTQSTKSIKSICSNGSQNIWLSTNYGLSVFNKKTMRFLNYTHSENDPGSLSSNDISDLYFDRAGSLWIGTNDGGLNKLDMPNPNFKKYLLNPLKKEGPTQDYVSDIYQDNKGNIWVSTSKGMKIFDPLNEATISKNIFVNRLIFHDKSGNILIAPRNNGLYKFNSKNNWICYQDSNTALYPERIFAFFHGRNNQYWLGNVQGDFYQLDPETKKIKVIKNIGRTIYTIYEDSKGLIWFGGYSTGLFCYDPQKNMINEYGCNSEDSLTIIDNTIYSFCEDKNSTIWFGCNTGLSRFNRSENNFTRYYGDSVFIDYGVMHILEDKQGNLWMSTGNGIAKFNPLTGKYTNYYSSVFLPEIEFLSLVGCKAENGEMYFGGTNGFVRFHPDSIKDDTFIPPVVITSFLKFDKPFLFGEEIELAHSDNFISFEFAALSYIHSEENQYAYMMEGIDKDWVYCGTRRFATYPNLNPGEYIFKVKGSNCNRVWNEAGTSIRIIILPPWWKTWWAYSLYVFVLLSIFFISSRFYLNRQRLRQKLILESEHAEKLEEVAKMKSDFFANISHEFRTPLTLIIGPAEKIEKNQSSNPIKDAGIITRNSKRLLQLVNQLLDLAKLDSEKLKLEASPGNIISFIKGIALSFESLSESKDVMIKIKSDKEFIEVYFDKEKMYKVFSNLLSNAFKFTPQRGNVIVSISELTNNAVEIKIKNTGVGIPKEELPKLFDRFYQVDSSQTKEYEGTGIGLALAKELIELHHGTITVDSEIGNTGKANTNWTEFIINLPLGREHLKTDEIIIGREEEFKKESVIEESEISKAESTQTADKIIDDSKTLILIVEDNYDMREYIKESLTGKYSVEEAVNGEQGVRIAETIIPDLIISDLMMPKMDGNELTRILKNDERTSHIPIIILTAKSGQENKIEGLLTGADDYLTKPFDVKELKVRVENLISIRKKLQEKFSKGDFLLKRSDKKLKSIDEKFLSKVLEVIEKHISEEEFSIEECSSEVGLSRTHFHKKLKALVGKSPSQYLRTVRLHRAKQMIEEETGNVSEVAYSVGFSSPAYFSKCFKEEFGYPPSNILT